MKAAASEPSRAATRSAQLASLKFRAWTNESSTKTSPESGAMTLARLRQPGLVRQRERVDAELDVRFPGGAQHPGDARGTARRPNQRPAGVHGGQQPHDVITCEALELSGEVVLDLVAPPEALNRRLLRPLRPSQRGDQVGPQMLLAGHP